MSAYNWEGRAFAGVICSAVLACGGGKRDDAGGDEGNLTTLGGDESSAGDGGDDGGDKLDVAGGLDGAGNGGDCSSGGNGNNGEVEFSNIWIANSPQGTVSKIDTMTGTELGRYASGPPEQAEPSRTSVNLYGDMAVSNRGSQLGGFGGVTKIAARTEDCRDLNANGSIETSTGATDVKPWGQDECVLWNKMIPSDMYQHGPRPTAWEGVVDNAGCATPDPRLWIAWYDFGAGMGKFERLNGSTGDVLDMVDVPGWNGLDYGPYGGAVNKEGDFWVVGWQLGPLVRVDGETLEIQRVDMPAPPADMQWSYGMSLDQYGNPWIASSGAAATYDVASGQWHFVSTGNLSMRGVMVDDQDRAWLAVDQGLGFGSCGLALVDAKARALVQGVVPVPGCAVPVGVSIDVEGFVWVVDQGANAAFKVDPDALSVALTVSGLQAPYTYSDMTGAGLNLVVNPPQG